MSGPESVPAMPGPRAAQAGGRPLIRRLVALALLGSAVALVVIQLGRAMRHDVQLDLVLAEKLIADLQRLELAVWEADEATPASLAVFRFDPEHRPSTPLRHDLELPNGRYQARFRFYLEGQAGPVEARRSLEVAGDVQLRLSLP